MTANKISGKVKVRATSSAASLFSEAGSEQGMTAGAERLSAPPAKLESPDPRTIVVNQRRLEEQLRMLGVTGSGSEG